MNGARWRRFATFNLFVAFAFTVMADPVSSVAYAIEAALRALDGDLSELVLTMSLVIGTIALVAATYHQLIGRYPRGGGSSKAMSAAFGEAWAFLPAGALLVDFTLTIAVSAAASASALIAYEPELEPVRMPLAAAITALVAAGCWFGHRGRVAFATATLAFVGCAILVAVRGAVAEPADGSAELVGSGSLGPALLAMPLGMALATGVEAPENAIAQLAQLDDRRRRIFGQLTLWAMLAIVGFLTLALTALAVRLDVGLPDEDSTLLADVARAATGGGASFAAFQGTSALLLLAAASSSYFAGSGLLKALALYGGEKGGLIPARFGRINRFLVPHWGLAVLLAAAAGLVALAGGRDQELVQFYAAAVFASFLGATLACARLSYRERRMRALAVNAAATAVVAFVLALNVVRLDPIASLAAAGLISLHLWRSWVRRGRPGGVAELAG